MLMMAIVVVVIVVVCHGKRPGNQIPRKCSAAATAMPPVAGSPIMRSDASSGSRLKGQTVHPSGGSA
jgi:hypothetical protein